MNGLTVLAAVYLLIRIVVGYKRGFMKTLFSMSFLVLVILSTAIFSRPMTKLFGESQHVTSYFERKSYEIVMGSSIGDTSGLNVGRNSSAGEVATAAIQLALSVAGVRSIGAEDLQLFLIRLTATAVTFLLSCIAGLLILIIINRLEKIKGIGELDHALGIPLGAARGLVTIWIVLSAISLLSFTSFGAKLAVSVTESPFLMALSRYNLVTLVIAKFVVGAL